jgi:hypothetical protein
MQRLTLILAVLGVTFAASAARPADGPALGHMVFFELNDPSEAAIAKLIAACDEYLSGHEGTLHYSAGARATDLERDVNQRDFHVALHVVFESRAAHDAYQTAPRHLKFIEENSAGWKNVKVYDSDLDLAE